jgi:hypothetical protein
MFKGYVDAVLAIWNTKTQKKYSPVMSDVFQKELL